MAEILYLIYLLSGIVKTAFIFYGTAFPLDLTLFTAVLLIVYTGYDFYVYGIPRISGKYSVPVFTLFLFFLWILISLLYTRSTGYAYRKTFLFITDILAFMFPLVIHRFNIKLFLKAFTVFVILSFFWFYYVYFILIEKMTGTDIYYRVKPLSLILGIYGGIILSVMITGYKPVFKKSLTRLVIIIILSVLVLLSGARGPILFVITVSVMFYANKILNLKVSVNINLNKILKNIIFIFPVLFAILIFGFYKYYDKILLLAERTIYRMSLIINGAETGGDMGNSVNVRIDQMKYATDSVFSGIREFLVGFGFGSFGIMYSGEDGRLYPHNVLLEIWFESGASGLIIFSVFLFSVFFGNTKKRIFVSGWVMIYILLNMMKSNSIIDIRVFFAFFALFIFNENITKPNEN